MQDHDIARTTVVGGRSPAADHGRTVELTGLELTLKRAAGSAAFRERLLQGRAAVAREEGIELTDSEAAVLDSVPDTHLESLALALVERFTHSTLEPLTLKRRAPKKLKTLWENVS